MYILLLLMHHSTTMASNNNGAWISDGSQGSTITVNDDDESVTATAATQGTPFNLRSKTGIKADALAAFSVNIRALSGNVSIGLVASEEFQPGWKTRGMFYNGNVSNGSAALIVGFGKYVQAGDQVGVRKFRSNDKTQVHFIVNGRDLGVAFCLEEENGGNKTFYPCVHVSGTVTFVYKEIVQSLAENKVKEVEETADPSLGFEGDWKVEAINVDGNQVELPPEHPIIISFNGGLEPTSIAVKVVNTARGSVKVTSQDKGAARGPGPLDIVVGPMASTMMLPVPPLDKIEQTITSAVAAMTKLTLAKGNAQLYMSGSGESSPKLTAVRYSKKFEPLTKY